MPIHKQAIITILCASAVYLLYLLISAALLLWVLIARPESFQNFIYELGKGFALTAVMIILLQVAIAARFRFVDRPFGFDIVFRFHKAAAFAALTMLFFHPILISWGSGNWALLWELELPWNILAGKLALVLLLINVVISFWRTQLHFEFQKWRWIHNIFGLTIIIAAVSHAYVTGIDFSFPAIKWSLPIFTAAAVVIYLYHKALRPLWRRRDLYTVTDVAQESPNVWTIKMQPPENRKRYNFRPGQFHFITFIRDKSLPREEHHWTISASPTHPLTASTIKESGDFTSTIRHTKVGDKANVLGPYGRFSYTFYPHEDQLVFICGGIGITPILSMLRHLRDTGFDKKILLLWSVRNEEDFICRDEIERIEAEYPENFEIIYFLTKPKDDWHGQTGRIDSRKIEKYLRAVDVATAGFYICAPPAMGKSVIHDLRVFGIKAKQIHAERFAL